MRPKDHEKPFLWGWAEVKLHSTCAQSVQCVLKGWGKFKVSCFVRRFASVLQTSNVLYLITMVQFHLYVKSTHFICLDISKCYSSVTLTFALVTHYCSS